MSALPSKYVPIEFSLVGVASFLMDELDSNDTVSTLWDRVRSNPVVRSFDRFADGLTLLYSAALIDIRGGIIFRTLPRRSDD
jgi:hypothetical protein